MVWELLDYNAGTALAVHGPLHSNGGPLHLPTRFSPSGMQTPSNKDQQSLRRRKLGFFTSDACSGTKTGTKTKPKPKKDPKRKSKRNTKDTETPRPARPSNQSQPRQGRCLAHPVAEDIQGSSSTLKLTVASRSKTGAEWAEFPEFRAAGG